MKSKIQRKGFTIIEVVLALSIIAGFFSILFVFMNNMFFFIKKNKDFSRFSEESVLIFSSIDPIISELKKSEISGFCYDSVLRLDQNFLEGFSCFSIAKKKMPNNFAKKNCYSNFFVVYKEKENREK